MDQELFNRLQPENIKSPVEFIAQLIAKMRAQEEYDTDLIDIIETHILKDAQTNHAAEQAFITVQRLAETRSREKNG